MKGQNEIKFYSYYILSTQLSRCKKENGNDEKKMFPNGTSGSGGMGKAGGFFFTSEKSSATTRNNNKTDNKVEVSEKNENN